MTLCDPHFGHAGIVSLVLPAFYSTTTTSCISTVGTGSSVVAAVRIGRNGYGVDLHPVYAKIAQERVRQETRPMLLPELGTGQGFIMQGDALDLHTIEELSSRRFHYAVTSPPYWSMLSNPGSENQALRRKKNLPLIYSESEHDLGNVMDYDKFLALLEIAYDQVADLLVPGGCLTVIVKNIKRDHTIYPLAWDLTVKLCQQKGRYEYLGTSFWCQDDVPLKPFAVGADWVSNTLHHYCLHFRVRSAM